MHAPNPELRAATALIFPDVDEGNLGDVDITRLLAMLLRNKVPLAALPSGKAVGRLRGNKQFAEAVASECEQRDLTLAVYSRVFEAWQSNGVQGVLIKSPGYFPYTSDNLDVLIEEEARPVAEKILEEMGYIELPHIREPNKRLYRKISDPNFGFPIHVHTRVEWGNIFLTDQEILETRRQSSELPALAYPSAENNILITTAHWLYEDKEVKLRDLYHTALELERPLDWDYIVDNARRKGWVGELRFGLAVYAHVARALRGSKPPLPDPDALAGVRFPPGARSYLRDLRRRRVVMPFALSKLFCKSLAFTKTARDRTLSFGARIREAAILVRYMFFIRTKRWHRNRRMVVSLSGVDGAGKTTLAGRLGESLELFGVHVHYAWMRLGSSTALEVVKSPLTGGRKRRATGSPQPKQRLAGRPRLGRLWGYVLMGDFVVRAWLKWLQSLVRGGVWVYDRYAVDAAVELDAAYDFPNAAVITKLVPRPSLSVLVKVDGEQARLRSDASEPDGYIDRTSRLYPEYENQYDLVLNGNRPLNDLVHDLPRETLKRYLSAT